MAPPPEPSAGLSAEEESAFYNREADAMRSTLPERAGLMRIAAAKMLAGDVKQVTAELERALKLAPRSPRVILLVRDAMAQLGAFDRVLELTDDLLDLGGDGRIRVSALLESAIIKRYHKSDPTGALACLDRAIDLDAGQVAALALRAGLQMEQGLHLESVESLEQLVDSINDPEERGLLLLTAGSLLEFRLDNGQRAEGLYARAAEQAPGNVFCLLALRDLHHRQAKWTDVCDDLERIAAVEDDAVVNARYLLQAGSFHLDRTGDLDAATRMLTASCTLAPEDLTALSRLAQVHEETGRYPELVDTLRAMLKLTVDPTVRPSLLCRVGSLLRHRVNQPERAIESYRQALIEHPGYLPALLALGTLHRQCRDFEGLVEILVPETEGRDNPERRAVWCLEIADIYAYELNRLDEAVRYYRRSLELAPGQWAGFWRLQGLLVQLQQHDALGELLVQRASATRDTKTRNYLFLQLARLQAGPLGELDEAIATMRRARQGGCRVASVELMELYERNGQYNDLAELLLSEAQTTVDPEEARGLRLQAGGLLEQSLGEPVRALDIYKQILADDPRNPAAAHAAGRTYHRLGRWKDLIELHRQELDLDPDRADTAELLYRIGRIHEEHLGHPEEAVQAYTKALERDPDYGVALEALVRVETRHAHLVAMLELHAGARKAPIGAAEVLCRAAELADAHLLDLDRAAQLYHGALERSPNFRGAIQGVLEVRLRQGRHEEAVQLLEQLAESATRDAELAQLHFSLARLKEFRSNDEQARGHYEQAAAASPRGGSLRTELLRLRRQAGQEIAVALQETAQAAADDDLAAAYLFEAAALHELDGAWGAQLAAADQAFRRAGELPAISWSLQRALRRMGEWGVLAALAERESERESDEVLRLSLIWASARAHLRAGSSEDARRLAQRCLDLDGGYLPALNLLAAMAEVGDRWEEVATLQDRIAAASEHRDNRLRSALRASDIWAARVGDPARALSSLRPDLTDDPGQPEAFARAERLLMEAGDHGELSKLLSRRIEASSDVGQQVELLRAHSTLLVSRLGDAAGAVAALGKLLELRPDDVEALSQCADLLCAQGRWSDAVETLTSLVERCDDNDRRREARLLQAQIWLDRLHDPRRAREVLARAMEQDPSNVAIKQLLVQVAFAEGDWERARLLLDEVAFEEETHLQVWALARQADVAHIGLLDEALRSRYDREALLLAAPEPAVLDQLVDRYRERGEQQRLVQVASGVLSDTARAEVASAMRLALARVLLEDMKNPEKALECLREDLVRDPGNQTSNLLFARALEQKGDMEESVLRYRKLLETDPTCLEAYRGLSRLMNLLATPAVATSALAALELQGGASASDQQRLDALENEGTPAGMLEVTKMPGDVEFHEVRQVFNLVLPYLGGMYPLQQGQVLRPTEPAALAAGRLAGALGLGSVQVSVEGTVPAAAGVGDPVPLQISAGLSRDPKKPAFRFWVGRALTLSAVGGSVAEQLDDRELGELLEALFVTRPIDPVIQQLRKQFHRAMPRKTRKAVEQLGTPLVERDFWARYRTFARHRSDEVGLLACGSPRVALRELTGARPDPLEMPAVRWVLQFMVSDAYANYHRALWQGATG